MIHEGLEVVKIGGSVLFNPQGQLRENVASNLLDIVSQTSDKTILVIGCGEFMHQRTIAAKLTDVSAVDQTAEESLSSPRLQEAFARYQFTQQILEQIAQLSKEGRYRPINPAHSFVKASMGSKASSEIVWFDRQVFSPQADIPLTAGGIVCDRRIMFSAISSDTIAAYLASKLSATRLVVLTATRGVYPSAEDHQTLSVLNISDVDYYQINGGMHDKIRRIKNSIEGNIPTYIASGKDIDLARQILIARDPSNCTQLILSKKH